VFEINKRNCLLIVVKCSLFTAIVCSSIMVLDAGRVKEFDPPNELLSNKSSVFFGMAKDAGLVN